MARIIRATSANPLQYRGLEWIFEYTNQDGALSKWNCGQAAAATFLTHHGAMDPLRAADNIAWLERHHPPDQLGGWFGTGRRRVERMLRASELSVADVFGIAGLRHELERANPVILMLGVSQGRWLGLDVPGGHWMVAFGCDAQHVYLSNGRPMRWDDVEVAWQCVAARWIRMNGRGLARCV